MSRVSPFGGGWLRQLYGDGGLDLVPIAIGNPIAQLVEALADFVPQVYAPVSCLSTAFGEADEVGDMPLPRLAIDADGLDQDGTVMDVWLLPVRAKFRRASGARCPADEHPRSVQQKQPERQFCEPPRQVQGRTVST
jgi:hypothetical protein